MDVSLISDLILSRVIFNVIIGVETRFDLHTNGTTHVWAADDDAFKPKFIASLFESLNRTIFPGRTRNHDS
jgi:hypothetical protein